jgi:hypothetical protein
MCQFKLTSELDLIVNDQSLDRKVEDDGQAT